MEIRSADGAWLRMQPVGYQFHVEPADDPDEPADWDDWLVIAVAAGTADGQTWSFSDPCLTTEEAQDLAGWLRACSAGPGPAPMLFTEPNLAFRAGPGRALDVDFSAESVPPWLPGAGLHRVYPLRLDVPTGGLARAAESWTTEIARFPRRVSR